MCDYGFWKWRMCDGGFKDEECMMMGFENEECVMIEFKNEKCVMIEFKNEEWGAMCFFIMEINYISKMMKRIKKCKIKYIFIYF